MTDRVYFSPGQLIFGGFLVFGLCAAVGLRLLWRGIRDDVSDASGTPVAGRGWFIIAGVLCLVPLAAFSLFAWRQGYFGHR
jgi:hypothetical protein